MVSKQVHRQALYDDVMKPTTKTAALAATICLTGLTCVTNPTWANPKPQPQLWGMSGTAKDNEKTFKKLAKTPQIAGTWDDTGTAPTNLYSINEGQYSNWNKPLDIAIGAIDLTKGQTWQKAAAGQMNEQWTQTLTLLNQLRPDQTTYIRFAHEFNGNWMPWTVTKHDIEAFKKSWKTFRKLQLKLAPKAKLVYCPNHMTSPELKYDWRKTWPGRTYVDYHCIDTYNQTPNDYNKKHNWKGYINYRDNFGAPAGANSHRIWATNKQVPMVIGEWGTNTNLKNSSAYIKKMGAWLHQHAGTGNGKIYYHIYFNIQKPGSPYQIWPHNTQKLINLYKNHVVNQ